jgi:hypothetical protein
LLSDGHVRASYLGTEATLSGPGAA